MAVRQPVIMIFPVAELVKPRSKIRREPYSAGSVPGAVLNVHGENCSPTYPQ